MHELSNGESAMLEMCWLSRSTFDLVKNGVELMYKNWHT